MEMIISYKWLLMILGLGIWSGVFWLFQKWLWTKRWMEGAFYVILLVLATIAINFAPEERFMLFLAAYLQLVVALFASGYIAVTKAIRLSKSNGATKVMNLELLQTFTMILACLLIFALMRLVWAIA